MRNPDRLRRILSAKSRQKWEPAIRKILRDGRTTLHLVGAGNPFRGDDSVGLHVVSLLLAKMGRTPKSNVVIHSPEELPERVLSRVDCTKERVLIFDAVETGAEPGAVVLANLGDTRFGYFATHNVPLMVIPVVAADPSNVYISGIEPESLDIGEELTETVRASANRAVAVVESVLGGGPHGPS